MSYKGEIGGELFDLDRIFVENSLVLKGKLEEYGKGVIISLSYEDMDRDILEKSIKLIYFLVDGGRKWVRFKDEYMVDENIIMIRRILNMANFYDIRVLEEYLVNFFAERIRTCKNEEDLVVLFKKD